MAPRNAADSSKNSERNEYIPSFIAKKPFYIDDATASQDDYLEHQRLQSQKDHDPLSTSKWYERGKQVGPAATKFRKGACENCGAMTHKVKDCLQRKRKLGARWTGKGIAADEVVQDVKLGWDAKRDRWNGYDSAQYEEVIDDYKRKGDQRQAEDNDHGAGDELEGVKYEEETDMGRQQSTATRNLRLREDTAKYLLNLDLDGAKYDPKTRSMQDTVDSTDEAIAQEGFQKASGDAAEFERAQRYAWETQERGDRDKLHLQANPTAGELSRKRKADDDLQKKEAQKKALLEKYGVQDSVQATLLQDAQVISNEQYVEYDERGRIKGAPVVKRKSMYAEDVFINNHTSVFGSWWRDFTWGYACCHNTVKNSFCTGEEGRKAIEEAEAYARGDEMTLAGGGWTGRESKGRRQERGGSRGERRAVEPGIDVGINRLEEIKRGVTEEEMEQYRRERTAKSDPMAKMLGKDALLDESGQGLSSAVT